MSSFADQIIAVEKVEAMLAEIERLQGIANQGIQIECELRIEIERLRRTLQGIADNDADRWPGQAARTALEFRGGALFVGGRVA